MDQENKNPEDVEYLRKLKSFAKKLNKRVRYQESTAWSTVDQEWDDQQFRKEREELLAILAAKILRDEEETERVWVARRAFMAEVKERRENSLKK